MTARTNSRVAGFVFLFYIANGIAGTMVASRVHAGETAATMLAGIARHASLFRLDIALTLLTTVDALVLAVAIYGLTRQYDPDLALLAVAFRVGEGTVSAMAAVNQTRVLALATANRGGVDAAVANQIAASLLRGQTALIAAILFSIGSALYCYIFVRARNIPLWLAWVGLAGSLLLCVCLPLQLLDLLHGVATYLIWIPVALFEIVLGVWLLAVGAQSPSAES